MKRNSLIASLVVILLVVAAAATALILGARPKLGLDLQGGISAVYQPDLENGPVPDDLDQAIDTAISLIRERVDSLGVAEPDIARQGNDILVQLPGIADPERAASIIGQTAQLTFQPVTGFIVPGTAEYAATPPCYIQAQPGSDRYIRNPDRPTATQDHVACGKADNVNEPAPTSSPTDTASPSPASSASPTDTSTTGAAPLGAPDAARVHAAAEGTASPAPSPSPTTSATSTASPSESASPTDTASPAPSASPTPVDDGLPADAPRPVKYQLGEIPTTQDGTPLTGSRIDDAFPTIAGQGWVVDLKLDGAGAEAFQQITADLACERDQGGIGQLAIVLDNVVESAPTMATGVACGQGIAGGSATITVGGGKQDAEDLALVLDVGALPISLKPATFQAVSPTLGAASLRNGLLAGFIGLFLVGIYLIFFYRWLGVIAIGALSIFGVLIVGLITAMGQIGFSLTLAGVAGIIVSIGITADSSIIFFERIRDEVALGKTMRSAVKRAFDSAFRTNLAGNTVTLAAALILYFLAVGPVRGFALTLGLSTVLDIIILWSYSRSVIGLLAGNKKLTKRTVRIPQTVTGGAQ